eukprot:scaffold437_cov168-Ochromonas_danica.AAC.59
MARGHGMCRQRGVGVANLNGVAGGGGGGGSVLCGVGGSGQLLLLLLQVAQQAGQHSQLGVALVVRGNHFHEAPLDSQAAVRERFAADVADALLPDPSLALFVEARDNCGALLFGVDAHAAVLVDHVGVLGQEVRHHALLLLRRRGRHGLQREVGQVPGLGHGAGAAAGRESVLVASEGRRAGGALAGEQKDRVDGVVCGHRTSKGTGTGTQ